jgi:MFS family permease
MMICSSDCRDEATTVLVTIQQDHICVLSHHFAFTNQTCEFTCEEDADTSSRCLYRTFPFWSFVTFMYVGCIGANVIMSITDAICFDIIGADGDYGRQRVWATVGYGVAALLSGYISTLFPQDGSTTYAPAFIIMLISVLIDIAICAKLKLPVIQAPKNMIKEFKHLLKDGVVVTFLTFATFVGILDSLIIFFLLWYLEDLAVATNTQNIKLIEGLTVAAEALGGEIIFFFISKKILNRFGHVNCFSACFFFYALRIGLISLAPSPWWIIPIEFCLNGPTFAMAYSAIVAYANDLAPAGASATMQGIAAGMDDGLGTATRKRALQI